MQGDMGNAEPLNFYPSLDDIFVELAQQSNNKTTIPSNAKKINQLIIEPLIYQEKEEDYDVHLHINTFTLEDTPIEELNTLQLAIVPST